jgi:hypothetical protein
MSAIRRPVVLVASVAVLGGALAACGSGPSQVNSAVIMGDKVITVDDVQGRLDTALRVEPAAKELAKSRKLDLVSRGIVTQLVRHELIAEAAKRENLTVSEKDVSDAVAQAAPSEDPVQKSVDAGFDTRELTRDRLLTVELGRKYLGTLQLVLTGVDIQRPGYTREQANDLARKMAAQPDQIAALAKEAAGQPSQENPAQVLTNQEWNALISYQRIAESGQPPQGVSVSDLIVGQFFAAPENSVIAVRLGSGEQTEWVIAKVARDPNGVPADLASLAGRAPAVFPLTLGERLLGPLAGELRPRLSPRYGVWDELAVGIVPSEGEKSGLVIPAGNRAKP